MSDNTTNTPAGVPPHFIVIVPGYMGSLLKDKKTGKIVWLDLPGLFKDQLVSGDAIDEMLDALRYPEDPKDNRLAPAGILNQVLIAPPWVKQEHYIRLAEKLKGWGYAIDPKNPRPDDLCCYNFSYDWRQDNRISGRELFKAIQGWQKKHPGAKAWLLAHSNGGIISRWCIQNVPGGREAVGRLILFGSPWDGAPKALTMAVDGLEVLGIRKFNLFNLGSRMKDLVKTFPSFYQLLPHTNPFARNANNEVVDLFKDNRWLDTDHQRASLADALKFYQEMDHESGVDTLCFYGTEKPTTTGAVVSFNAAGGLAVDQWIETNAGDGTVPERSAKHPWVAANEMFPFTVGHGDIYIYDPAVKFLKKELIDKYSEGKKRATLLTPDYSVVFLPVKNFYDPGEPIQAWAQVNNADGAPISGADVKVSMAFVEALPGSTVKKKPKATPAVFMDETVATPGRYEGELKAPTSQGYYRLHCTIKVVRKPGVALDELVVVDTPA